MTLELVLIGWRGGGKERVLDGGKCTGDQVP